MNEELKKCPFCAEDIRKDAIKCSHCKENLDLGSRLVKTGNQITNTGNKISSGIFGFVIIIVAVIWIFGGSDSKDNPVHTNVKSNSFEENKDSDSESVNQEIENNQKNKEKFIPIPGDEIFIGGEKETDEKMYITRTVGIYEEMQEMLKLYGEKKLSDYIIREMNTGNIVKVDNKTRAKLLSLVDVKNGSVEVLILEGDHSGFEGYIPWPLMLDPEITENTESTSEKNIDGSYEKDILESMRMGLIGYNLSDEAYALALSGEWGNAIKKIDEANSFFSKANDKIIDLSPPIKHEKMHDLIISGISKFKQSNNLVKKGIKDMDANLITQAAELFEEGDEAFNMADTELKKVIK